MSRAPDQVDFAARWSSDRTLRLEFARQPSLDAHVHVRRAFLTLRAAAIPHLIDLTPAYATLTLTFDPRGLDFIACESRVRDALLHASRHDAPEPRTITLPVCYEGPCAPDLADVAAYHGLTTGDVVALHSSAEYVVAFLGFSPGFPYLFGLPTRLATPRLETPRSCVPVGSVGIAGVQTGVYPHATPGGWRLIGRTPLRLFDATRAEPSLLTMGDRVRFQPVALAAFNRQEGRNL